MQDFDALWNYSEPKATEEKFREILANTQDINYIAELKTQIARTLGLQRKFDDGHILLSEIENDIIQVELYPNSILFVPNYWYVYVKGIEKSIIEKVQYKTILNEINFLHDKYLS